MAHKLTPLLPRDNAKNNPLFIIVAILAFLACLCLLSFKASHAAISQWQADLEQTATVQIKPNDSFTPDKISLAKEILLKSPSISAVDILSHDASKALLQPWLGDVSIPDDLPLPILLHIQLHPDIPLDTLVLQSQLMQAGIDADIDDHTQWMREFVAKMRVFQSLALLAFILITIAVLAACIFAVRAGILGHKKFMDILHQIGAEPRYTARIFSAKFFASNFKASLLGSVCAFIVLLLVNLSIGHNNSDALLPKLSISFSDVILASCIPFFIALISGLVSWYAVIKSLHNKVYS